MPYAIRDATSKQDIELVAGLFLEYSRFLNIDLSFQDFQSELDALPGKYATPKGCLLVAVSDDHKPLGCVAMRPLEGDACEMKRLYVTDNARGLRLGRALMDEILERARQAGYKRMRLDTLTKLTAALSMYKKNGFYEIPAYYDTPLPNTVFLEKAL